MINIIVAYDENRVIGNDDKIPWKIPEDMEHFKNTTMGHPVIMGRKTWDSIPKKYRPLPGRTNILISHYGIDEDIEVFHDLEHAARYAEDIYKDVFIIGGESIYKQALDLRLVDRVIASEISRKCTGNKYFPELKGYWHGKLIKKYSDFNLIEYYRWFI